MTVSFEDTFDGSFGDERLAKRARSLAEKMTAGETSVVRRLASGRAETVAFGRFLDNDAVTTEEIFAAAGMATGDRAVGRRVLAIQDTTALSFPRRAGGDLGPGGDGKVPGLFLHPVLALDADSGIALGLAAGTVWTRAPGKVTPHKERDIEDRESWRWIEQGQAAKDALGEAAHVTLLADRESDIYEQWALLPEPGFDLLTRACKDRRLADGTAMFATARSWLAVASYVFDITARKNRPERQARMQVRFGTVTITKPKTCRTENMPKTITLQLVEVMEVGAPKGQEPVLWRLLTTAPVTTVEEALAVVRLYQRRWQIEEYNRTLKKSGIDLEGAMIEGVHALQNLVAMGAVAGVAVMQLVEGRDAGAERRASEAIDATEEEFAACLCPTLEGKTAKQKNPHASRSLAWLSWIIARLGGWSGYTAYGPAGPKTMAHGWEKFKNMAQGWILRRDV
jgi:hypothetical protein